MTLTFAVIPKERWWTEAFSTFANRVAEAIFVVVASFLRETPDEWVTVATRWATTAKASDGVSANSRVSTLAVGSKSDRTFVYIYTLFTSVSGHTHRTRTAKGAQCVGAL